MSTSDDQASDQKTRQDLVKSTIALFLSFALGLKMEALKSVMADSTELPLPFLLRNPDFLLMLVFFFTWFSFFLGVNFYMSQTPSHRSAWRIDLVATMITLLAIVLVGATANDKTKSLFLLLLVGLYLFEFVWDCVHLKLPPIVPKFWYIADLVLALFTLLFWGFPSLPLGLLVLGHLGYAIWNFYELT